MAFLDRAAGRGVCCASSSRPIVPLKHTGETIHPKNGMAYGESCPMTSRNGEELKPRFIDVGLPASAATVPQS